MGWHRCRRWRDRIAFCPFRLLEEEEERDDDPGDLADVAVKPRRITNPPQAEEIQLVAILEEVKAGVKEADAVVEAQPPAEPPPEPPAVASPPERVPEKPKIPTRVPDVIKALIDAPRRIVNPGTNALRPTGTPTGAQIVEALKALRNNFTAATGQEAPLDPEGVAASPLTIKQESKAYAEAAATPGPSPNAGARSFSRVRSNSLVDPEVLRIGNRGITDSLGGTYPMLLTAAVAASVIALGMHRGMTMAQIENQAAKKFAGKNLSKVMPTLVNPNKAKALSPKAPPPKSGRQGFRTGGGWGAVWKGGSEVP